MYSLESMVSVFVLLLSVYVFQSILAITTNYIKLFQIVQHCGFEQELQFKARTALFTPGTILH